MKVLTRDDRCETYQQSFRVVEKAETHLIDFEDP